MELLQNGPQFLRKRKFLLVLPVLILPFLILFFIALGGGKGNNSVEKNSHFAGLNVKLPDAHFKKGSDKSKLVLYDEVSRDSSLIRNRLKNDPYYLLPSRDMSFDSSKMRENTRDQNEVVIMEKLTKLKSVIQQKSALPNTDHSQDYSYDLKSSSAEKFKQSKTPENIPDPRMDQIGSMLDKVMAIQHPELMEDSMVRLRKQHITPAFTVSLSKADTDPETFGAVTEDGSQPEQVSRFNEPGGETKIENEVDNTIEVVTAETQVLVSGSIIKFRLLDDIRIEGHLIEKNQFIYGVTTLSGERMKIQFSSVRSGQNILPVSLEAYDMDGLAGIYIPGSINRDVAKESSDRAIGSIGLTTLDPSIGAQAAGAGIQAAKTLLSRKVKLTKVTVKAGYRVLLKDSREK